MTDAAELYEQMPACRPACPSDADRRLGAGRADLPAGRQEAEELDAAIRRNLEGLGYGE